MNRLPRQLRPEWVVTPCRRLLARFRLYYSHMILSLKKVG
ncbi:MAG: hypothetical protein [Olavius algarvensis Gamma 1 endosymbiont]|nr:MAG: hypothetical protein [Olavius algarvensis Gamma 1 endosymbiont]